MQCIFIVEADKKCGSDSRYIKELLKRVYKISGVKISFVYMGSKSKYLKSEAMVKTLKKKYKGNSVVYMCIDTDSLSSNSQQIKETNDVINYSKSKGYELIWFYEDIEQVFLGNSVNKRYKKSCSEQFIAKNQIDNLSIGNLAKKSMNSIPNGSSNILIVLDKYLTRK